MANKIMAYNNEEQQAVADTFDKVTGQAALQGTLTVENLLFELRAHIVAGAAPDLDSYAHTVLEL